MNGWALAIWSIMACASSGDASVTRFQVFSTDLSGTVFMKSPANGRWSGRGSLGFAGPNEGGQGVWIFFEKRREIRKHIDGGRAEMMLDPLDIPLLRFRVEPEQRKKTGQRFMSALDASGHRFSLGRQDQSPVLLVIQVAQFAEFLD